MHSSFNRLFNKIDIIMEKFRKCNFKKIACHFFSGHKIEASIEQDSVSVFISIGYLAMDSNYFDLKFLLALKNVVHTQSLLII